RALCLPMTAHGDTVGLLYLDGRAAPRDGAGPAGWSDTERRLAKTLAEQAAPALAHLTLPGSLRLQSIRDPLTGLYNRRYLDEAIERELSRARRKRAPLGILMIDVDHFKRFNDTYGHDAGDNLLAVLAEQFRAHVRAEDILCRYGG